MQYAGIELVGTSRSGVGTCLVLPTYGITFDMGTCLKESWSSHTVFITHGHPDHIGALVQHAAIRGLMGSPPATYYMSYDLLSKVQASLDLAEAMQTGEGGGGRDHDIPAVLRAISPGGTVSLGKGLSVRCFQTDHTIPSQGYALIRTKLKLKPQYANLDGQGIGMLRKQGVLVQDSIDVVEVAYPGDTRATVLDTVPELMEAKLLVMESTFLGDDQDKAFASKRGHTHLEDHADRAGGYHNEAIVLTHWSLRHEEAEILSAVKGLPESLGSRCHVLL